jgi:tRNA nucleotidyltransferase (CCA-adding enzyme)
MRAEELGVLAKLSPALKGDSRLAERFSKARRLSSPGLPPAGIYLALLAYPLSAQQLEQLVAYLRLPKLLARTLRDTAAIRTKLHELADPELRPSAVYHLLDGYSPQALTANMLAGDSPRASEHIRKYLDKLRHIKPKLSGNDLIKLGMTPGPQLKELLNRLLDARLDGKVASKKDEERLVKGWLGNRGQSSP